jgi:uncharacterized protein with HEPN domain
MKNRDETLFLEDIIRMCEEIKEFLQGISKEDFINSKLLQAGIVRDIEIIGEAAKNISTATREKFPDIPWKAITGMRDKVVHHYFRVDIDEVWKTATEDVPQLQPDIKRMLKDILES